MVIRNIADETSRSHFEVILFLTRTKKRQYIVFFKIDAAKNIFER